ncbi:MAG: hypothetical protein II776_00935 [Clostridia bacterium]|nr:hypothetical protein [Clostridia bacterium]
MKFTEIDLQCEDIMWFGIDKNGLVFECTSGGIGCVPKFVCESKENTAILESFFLQELKETTQGTLLIPGTDSQLSQDVLSLSKKGVYCFDVAIDDGRPNEYKKIAAPDHPIMLSDLPDRIKSIMCNHIVDVDVASESLIRVAHAY